MSVYTERTEVNTADVKVPHSLQGENGNGHRTPETAQALNVLRDTQGYTAKLIDELRQRLQPALTPSVPVDGSPKATSTSYRTEVASSVQEMTERQENFNSQLRDLIDRLEI